jgi:hypothetical protein
MSSINYDQIPILKILSNHVILKFFDLTEIGFNMMCYLCVYLKSQASGGFCGPPFIHTYIHT